MLTPVPGALKSEFSLRPQNRRRNKTTVLPRILKRRTIQEPQSAKTPYWKSESQSRPQLPHPRVAAYQLGPLVANHASSAPSASAAQRAMFNGLSRHGAACQSTTPAAKDARHLVPATLNVRPSVGVLAGGGIYKPMPRPAQRSPPELPSPTSSYAASVCCLQRTTCSSFFANRRGGSCWGSARGVWAAQGRCHDGRYRAGRRGRDVYFVVWSIFNMGGVIRGADSVRPETTDRWYRPIGILSEPSL
ncbi:uncharacterized protein A4U43_C10F1730 [Asparagus officinalis]|uniref:Uncharacterized protein n=1 Tax=Asparagus officinalis TaxID=4686 RepID=A0A5P1DZZ4_ASPOF|nr:uncharacterized protein A4U43_C10F1730 [Asparagus officinalis]